jgi:hypothetical protein
MKLVGSANDLNPDNLMEVRRTALPDDACFLKALSGWHDTVRG